MADHLTWENGDSVRPPRLVYYGGKDDEPFLVTLSLSDDCHSPGKALKFIGDAC
jgi:hypothetical protein